ncbi:hypothetical protein M5X06_04525 [Paenibacillus alvei]|uniref:Uncharacterized protein n=1 Tax=Paenibacillus alvei TaxID=44250 RepID=A0ABT4H2Z8_PAEAL|nr:hypothetical protein [Paenibacillus alvei]MCY9763026.1 hypothetical protein [Paenibacillus alvei]MCY9766104.1 hypothetical protein [Paenibacillus alvei]
MPYEAKTNWKYDDTVTEKDLNRIEQGLKDAHVAEYKDITLQPGAQIIEAENDTPFKLGSIKGRTLANLLGRNGRFVDLTKYIPDAVTAEKEGDYLKVTLNGSKERGTFRTPTRARVGEGASKYLLVGVVNAGTAKSAHIELSDEVNYAISSNPVTGTEDQVAFAIFDGSKTSSGMGVYLHVLGSKDSYAYFKDLRVFEISDEDAKLLFMTAPETVGERYPYVDSITNILNPYIISRHGNMLPPFHEWNYINEKGIIVDQYLYRQREYSSATWTHVTVPVASNTNYSLAFNGTNNIKMRVVNGNESTILLSDITECGVFNSGLNNTINVYVHAGVHGEIKNPMLIPTSDIKEFIPRYSSIWAAECQLAANPVDRSNADVLNMGDDGLPYVFEKWKKVTLDDSNAWSFGSSKSGYKTIYTRLSNNYAGEGSHFVSKYDGTVLGYDNSLSSADVATIDFAGNGNLNIAVSNADSGWGDSYTPSNDEIKAYFLGWKMYAGDVSPTLPYNRTDGLYKKWCYRDPFGADGLAGGTETLPTTQAPITTTWQPYRLQYLKAKPTTEPASNYETGLTLSKGWNMVQVGSSVVLREKANFAINAANTHYCVNTTEGSDDAPTPFHYRTEDILSIFKNQKTYAHWEKNIFLPYGKYRATIVKEYYDPTAVYHVTYTMLDPTLSAPINGSIATNLRSALTEVVQWSGDVERRLSVVETKKAEKDTKLQFIKPTLLNDWKLFGESGRPEAGYCKDRDGFVYLTGVITGGIVGVTGKPAFVLPVGYRPKRLLSKIAISTSSSNAAVDIAADGGIYIITGDNYFIALDTISPFLAEQ